MMVVEAVPIDGNRKPPTTLRALAACALAVLAATVPAGCRGGMESKIDRVSALGRKPTEPNLNRIVAMADDPDRDVRANVILVLNSADSARARTLARRAIDDRDGVVRGVAVEVLAPEAAGDPDLAHTLAAMATQDAVWQVRRRALGAIDGIDDPGVRAAFEAALADAVRQVRRAALEAGHAHPGLLPVERVADLSAKDPDWENRVAAAGVLAASGDAAALPALAAAEADPNEFVRAEAARGRRVLEKAVAALPAPPAAAAPAAPAARREAKPGSGV